jgi:hypothetical protein
MSDPAYQLEPVGWVESPLTDRAEAPKQGDEGAPQARIVFRPEIWEAAADLCAGDEILVLTWLHQGNPDTPPATAGRFWLTASYLWPVSGALLRSGGATSRSRLAPCHRRHTSLSSR